MSLDNGLKLLSLVVSTGFLLLQYSSVYIAVEFSFLVYLGACACILLLINVRFITIISHTIGPMLKRLLRKYNGRSDVT